MVKQATANPLDVSEALRDRLPDLTDNLPQGMQVEIAYDKSVFIAESIDNVNTTIGEAIVLVVLIIFFFLRSLRATIIPLVTIPVSLIGAFAMMYFLGFSINTLTLLALVLAIGLVVDDAIVMLENIFRHVEAGMSPLQAAYKGSSEIAMAVVAMTLTLAAVYTPIAFMTGTTGRLFTEFALTLAGTVLVSGFVALTLSPMMCSKLLRHEKKHNVLYNLVERALGALTAGYRWLLLAALRARPLVLLIGLCVAGSSYFLFNSLDSELAPYEDQGTIIGVVHRSDRVDQPVHRQVCPPARADLRRGPGGGPLLRRGRLPGALPGHLLHQARAVGPARAQPAGDRQRAAPEDGRGARRAWRSRSIRRRSARAAARRRCASSSRPRSPTASCRRWSSG